LFWSLEGISMESMATETRVLVPGQGVVASPSVLMHRIDPAAVETWRAYANHRGYWANELAFWHYQNVRLFPRDAVLFNQDDIVVEAVNYPYTRENLACAVDDEILPGQDKPQRRMAERFIALGERECFQREAILCFHKYYHVYTHWMVECLFTLYLVLRDDVMRQRLRRREIFLLFPQLSPPQKNEIERILSHGELGLDSVIQCDMADDVIYLFEKLVVPTSLLARTWVHPETHHFAKAYRDMIGISPLRKAAANHVRLRKIYISRRDAAARRMTNEAELEAALLARGFEITLLSEMSILEQANVFSDSDLILGAHGSGLANLLFAREGTFVIEIRADRHEGRSPMWDRSFASLASVLKQSYGFIMCKGDENSDQWQAPVAGIVNVIDTIGYGI
jgi:capsular polysaccharide biosynthesis protein